MKIAQDGSATKLQSTLYIACICLSGLRAECALPGQALSFDGSNDFVQVPDSDSVRITGPITVEAWIKRSTTGVQHSIVEKYGCPVNGVERGGYALRVLDSGKLLFQTKEDCNIRAAAIGGTTLQANTWYHVAGVWNGTELRVYVNGILDGSTASTSNPKPGSTPLIIGARGNDQDTPFAGVLDEVRLWNAARTQSQLAANKDGCLSGSESGLAGYWRFNEGSGTVAHDATLHHNDGQLINGPVWVPSPTLCAEPPVGAGIRTLTVSSENPNAGVAIQVTPNDRNGEGNGTTQFTRQYSNSPIVTLTAPLTAANSNSFLRWKLDGIDQSAGQRVLNVNLGSNHTASAVYQGILLGSGQALLFDGTNDFVQIPDSDSVRITGSITVEAWIKRTSRGVQHSIMEKYDCDGGGYVLRVTSEDNLLFATLDDCSNFSLVTSATSLQSNTWYHVAGVWDGSQLRVYVNGILDGTANSSRNPKAGTSSLIIGARGNDLGTPFAGVIDEVRLWNLARTETELATNKDSCLTGTETGLAGYWRFNEGSGIIVIDSTTNGNHGVLDSPIWVPSPLVCGGPVTSPLSAPLSRLEAVDGQVRLAIAKDSSLRACRVTVTGPPGSVSIVETSGDLRNWTPMVQITNTTGESPVFDFLKKRVSGRYYRVRQDS